MTSLEYIRKNAAWSIPLIVSALTASGTGIKFGAQAVVDGIELRGYNKGKAEQKVITDSLRTEKRKLDEKYIKAMRDAMYYRLKYEFLNGSGPEPIGEHVFEPEEWTVPTIQPADS